MKHKISRMEGNKEVRRVLARHGTDFSYCTYSCTGREVRLTGSLVRTDGGEFNFNQVESMIQDILRHLEGFSISGDLDNWNFTQDHINRLRSNDEQSAYFEEGQEEEAA